MSTYGLTLRVVEMEKKLQVLCDLVGVGEASDQLKSMRLEIQNLRERLEVLESDTVDTIETKTEDGTHTRHIPKRRSRKPVHLS